MHLTRSSDNRYLICNAKESDPGSYADRSVLEGDPHRLIEGICIASYAIGASNAVIYPQDRLAPSSCQAEKGPRGCPQTSGSSDITSSQAGSTSTL
ncbi:MAG: hypothetical protein MZV63_28125 [Marinilabiliales bacterium]|nr:hypothetical protein [Marinilabiliales bacterium]